jgi:hypothetical protein
MLPAPWLFPLTCHHTETWSHRLALLCNWGNHPLTGEALRLGGDQESHRNVFLRVERVCERLGEVDRYVGIKCECLAY